MPESRIALHGFSIAAPLYDFVNDEALPGTGLDEQAFWEGFTALLALFSSQIRDLERQIAALLTQDPLWEQLDRVFRSIKGVADRTVARLLAELPEIGTQDGKAISKLVPKRLSLLGFVVQIASPGVLPFCLVPTSPLAAAKALFTLVVNISGTPFLGRGTAAPAEMADCQGSLSPGTKTKVQDRRS